MTPQEEKMYNFAVSHIFPNDACDVLEDDAAITEYMLLNCDFTIPEGNRFFCKYVL